MNKIVLITVKDCYPFENVNCFETVAGVDIYKDCIRSLDFNSDNDKDATLIQQLKINKLFVDERATWTQKEDIFYKYITNGIPLLKKEYNEVTFYILPCLGYNEYLGREKNDTKLRQVYTSNCIGAICGIESIERKEIYAIIHSDDIGVKSDENRRITKEELSDDSPLRDIAANDHLYLFHHSLGKEIYDSIIYAVCTGKDIDIDTFNKLFPQKNDWRDKLYELDNNDKYQY